MTSQSVRTGCVLLALALQLSPRSLTGETWDGGGANNNWTTPLNWNSDDPGRDEAPPNDGTADIVIAGTTRLTPLVNVAYDIRSLTFNNTAGAFVILGPQELTIGAGGITNSDADIQSVFAPVELSVGQTWNAAAGRLQMDAINLNGFTLALAGTHPVDLLSAITGTGRLGLGEAFSSTVTMAGGNNNTYTGETVVAGGTLRLQKTLGAVAVAGNLGINSGGSVVLGGNEQISHAAGTEVTVGHPFNTGTLNLNGFNETINGLTVQGGSVMTGAGTLSIGQFLSVWTADASITGNLELGDVSANVFADGQVVTSRAITIGEASNGSLSINSGGDVTNGEASIGNQAGSTGRVNVSNDSTWTTHGQLFVGNGGGGTLDITAGGEVSGGTAFIGFQSGATGAATIDGSGSSWITSASLVIGYLGAGTLDVTAGGFVRSALGIIGNPSGAGGEVNVDGMDSEWTMNTDLFIGGSSTIGTLSISNGGRVNVGRDTLLRRGQVNVSNGIFHGDEDLTIHGGTTLDISNAGTVTVGGVTDVQSVGQSAGRISVNGSTFDVNGDLTINGGSLTADAGAVVDITQAFLRNGATITVENDSELTQTAGSLFMESGTVVRVNSGATYNTDFTIVGNTPGPQAQLIVDGADTLVKSMSCCIDVGLGGTGIMNVTGGARIETPTGAVGSFAFGSAPSIGTLTLDGTDASGNPSSWVIVAMNVGLHATSQGTIHVRNGALFRATTGLAVGTPGTGRVMVEGTDATGNPSLLDVATLSVGTGGYGNGSGEVTASSGGRIQAGNIRLAPTGGAAILTVTDTSSSLVQSGASTITVGHAMDGSAVINVRNGARFTTGTGDINVNATGEINLESGAVFDAHGPININDGDFNFLGGTLHAGAFNGNLENEGGRLAPGHSVGTTSISGNYTQRAAASLEIEIGGVLAADWDALTVGGNAILDGTLDVRLLDDFEPVIGNSFTIITTDAGNVGGQFDVELFPVVNGLTFDVIYNAKSVVLQVIESALPGDHNGDGTVDAADYVLWRKNDGTQEGYDTWRTNFGRTAASGSGATVGWAPPEGWSSSAAVPEPSALIMVCSALAVGWPRCRFHLKRFR